MTRLRARQKGIDFQCELDPSLPHTVNGDEKRLRQIIQNLLGNAVKFTDNGSVTFRVRPMAGKIRFEVLDTGVGIHSDMLEEIFQPFHQVGERRFQIEGSGLGLAISQRLARAIGSELHVESEPQSGARFWFDVELPEVDTPRSTAPKSTQHVIGYKGNRRRVLVVDDTYENRRLMLEILNRLDFIIEDARSGEEALQILETFRPDLILMDIVLPGLDGFQTTRQIRKNPLFKQTTIIGISASVFDTVRTQSLEAGCDAFLPKPVDVDQLLETIRALLEMEWIFQLEEETKGKLDSERIIAPPEAVMQKLLHDSRIGDLGAMLKDIEHFRNEYPDCEKFFDNLKAMAKNFRIKQMNEYIHKYLD